MRPTFVAIQGFKTFARRTELPLSNGLIGLVGANGSGKSNVIEALRWLLGNDSRRLLRVQASDDLLFAGSQAAAQRNRAEVSIHFELAADQPLPLPIEHDGSLQITRILERGKGSYYLVNDQVMLKRDVQILLDETGFGGEQTVISQGQVQKLAEAKPEERYQILEAALALEGVKLRQKAASHRIREAQNNLKAEELRLASLASQTKELENLSRRADRYRRLCEEIEQKEAELKAQQQLLQLTRYHQAVKQAEQRQQESQSAAALVAAKQAALQALQLELESLNRDANALHGWAVANEGYQQKQAAQKAQQERSQALYRQQLDQYERQEKELAEERAALTQRAESLGLEQAQAKQKLAQLEGELAQKTLAQRESQRAKQDWLAQKAPQSPQAKAEQQKKLAQERSNELQQTQTLLQKYEARLVLIKTKATAFVEVLSGNPEEPKIKLTSLQGQQQQLQQSLAQEKSAQQEQLQRLQEKQKAHNQQQQALAAVERALLLTEESPYPELAALPAYAELLPLLFDSKNPAQREQKGDWLQGWWWQGEPKPHPLLQQPAPGHLARLFENLQLVDDEPQALQAAQNGQLALSRDGSLYHPDGWYKKQTASDRKSRFALEQEKAQLAQSLAQLAAEKEQAQSRLASFNNSDTEENLQRVEQELREQRHWVEQLDRRRKEAKENLASLEQEQLELESKIPQLQAALDEILAKLQRLEEQAQSSADPKVLQDWQQLQKLESLAEEQSKALAECQKAFQSSEQQLRWLESQLEQVEQNQKRLAQREQELSPPKKPLEEKTLFELSPPALPNISWLPAREAGQNLDYSQTLDQIESKKQSLQSSFQEEQRQLMAAQTDQAVAEKALGLVEAQRLGIEEKLPNAKTLITKITELPSVESAERLLEQGRSELARKEGQREQMGAIDLAAEAKAKESLQQLAEAKAKTEELAQAIAALEKENRKLEQDRIERLRSGFAAFEARFLNYAQELFPRAKVQVALELASENPDPTDSQNEVENENERNSSRFLLECTFPNRRGKSMQGLSGGEQSLLSLALILALQGDPEASTGSPGQQASKFSLMDEADAALDDRNSQRFARLLEKLSQQQDRCFLVVTHNPVVMESAVRLFGVTMQEPGISSLFSYNKAEQKALSLQGVGH